MTLAALNRMNDDRLVDCDACPESPGFKPARTLEEIAAEARRRATGGYRKVCDYCHGDGFRTVSEIAHNPAPTTPEHWTDRY